MTPVSIPFSQWSNQRRHSCRKPIVGPGSASCGNACAHGPISPLRGAGETVDQPRDRVAVAVRPAADGVDRRLDGAVVLADRALLPVGVAALVASQGSTNGGVPSSRSSHVSRQPSPTAAGSGGSAYSVSIVAAHWSMSTPSTQPPM